MEVDIVRIGNSKGIRIPKAILKKYGIKTRLELILEEGRLVLIPVEEPRKGWDEAFSSMHEQGDDAPLMDDVFDDEDFDEWS